MVELNRCIYCNQDKELSEFSLEHIFPDALGGAHFSDLFKTRNVCIHCNSTSGLFIDGPFIKSFFSQNDKSEAALRFINLKKASPLPLKYMGILKNIVIPQGKECDFWMGPHGGLVYYNRNKADKKWDCMLGGNPIVNKKHVGTAYIFAQNSDEYWLAVLLLSCRSSFKGSRFISGNIGLSPVPEGEQSYFDVPTQEENNILEQLKKLQGNQHQCTFAIQDGFEQRFVAKLALALGANIFGDHFLNTEFSKCLRNALWEKDLKKRQECGVQFYKYFVEENKLSDIFAIEGAHTLILYPNQDILNLIVFVYGKKMLMVPLCIDKSVWEAHTQCGYLFIAAPQVEKFLGPFDIAEFIAYKGGIMELPALDELMKNIFDVSTLPKITD